MSHSVPVTGIGAVDGPPESQLFRVRDATRLDDGRVVVANNGTSEVRVYGPDGAWIRTIGRKGNGPGEFPRGPEWLDVQGDTVLVVDQLGVRALRFTLDGAYLDDESVPGVSPFLGPDGRLPDGRWFQRAAEETTSAAGVTTVTQMIVAWHPDRPDEPDTIIRAPGREYVRRDRPGPNGGMRAYSVPTPLGPQSHRAFEGGTVAMGDGVAYDIHVRDVAGRRLRIRRPLEPRPVTEADVDRHFEHLYADVPPDRLPELRDRTRGVPPGRSLPTWSGLAVARTGRLWVERFRPPWQDDQPRLFDVFDPDGRWLGEVAVPEGLEVMEIGEDYVLGVERDELEVEYVRVYGAGGARS